MRRSVIPLLLSLAVTVATLLDVYAPTFPVNLLANSDNDFTGSVFAEHSGSAYAECQWYAQYYNCEGDGGLTSGTGDGYYGMSNYWYTDEGQINGGTHATHRFWCVYNENGDSTGKASSFVRAYLFVYKYQDGGWVCVGDEDVTINNNFQDRQDVTVYYNFDSSKYKFRSLIRVEFSQTSVTNSLELEVNDGTSVSGQWLKVFDT